MAPAKVGGGGGRTISQQAFDEMVKENVEDLEMDPTEALQDAIQTLTLQGVDLSGIVTCLPGESNPLIEKLERLKGLTCNWSDVEVVDQDVELNEVILLLNELSELCRIEGSGNAAIATRNGGVELVCLICSKIDKGKDEALVSALTAMASLLHDLGSTEIFRSRGGPKILANILNNGAQNVDVLNQCFSVVSAAATGNEVLKESFMDLKLDEHILTNLHKHSNGSIPSLYDAIQSLLTADDNRVVASQVYGYARQFAKIGISEALVDLLHEGLRSPSLVSAATALKSLAVNDEICRSIAESGGIDALLCCIEDSGQQGNKIVARSCCSLLSKLAGSDANKCAIVEKGGMLTLIKLSGRFPDDPSVLQEVMSIFCSLCLRSPENATRAMEAGAGDLAIQAMEKFPRAPQLQKNACLMIRNLVARNPENRPLLLSLGLEKIIRKAKESHENCKDAATAALRDLGIDNYNS